MDSDEQVLWERWRDGHDMAARNALIVQYSPWTRIVARDVFMRIHSLRDSWQDCAQNALIGMLEAMDRFDPGRGVSFQTFARYRIRGAVFNGLRHLCESLAQGAQPNEHANTVKERIESLDESENQDPLGAFVATTVGLGLGFLLEAESFPGREETPDAYSEFERGELSTAVLEGIEQLDKREQMILALHYYHHVPFVDIAHQLGVTKGRISQLHKRALVRLRGLLASRVLVEY